MLTTLALATLTRFAVMHDGNYHDQDDIGAAAMSQALIWKAGVQDDLVWFGHSSHIGATDSLQHQAMRVSSHRAAWPLYGIAPDVVHDTHAHLHAAVLALAAEIDASTDSDRLTIIQGGPWEMMALAFDHSDPVNHQHVTIVSHSNWNDTHKHLPAHRDKASFFAQYPTPGYVKIVDQNGPAFKQDAGLEPWAWMVDQPETYFVYRRTASSSYAAGDMSDAGMVFWFLTGMEFSTMGDVQAFFD